MRQQQMTHKRRPVAHKEFQRLPVRQVSLPTPDAVLQMIGITPFFQHLLVIIGFQKGGMALPEITGNLLTGITDVREDADMYIIKRDDKTMRVRCIMRLRESRHL